MKKDDLKFLCTTMGGLAGIPIRIYNGSKQIFYYSVVDLCRDPITACIDEILKQTKHVCYLVTAEMFYYGIAVSGDCRVVVGPARQTPMTEAELRQLAFVCDVPQDKTAEFVGAMQSIVQMPLASIIAMMCSLNFVLNGEKLTLSDVLIEDKQQKTFQTQIERERADKSFVDGGVESSFDPTEHNTYTVEQTLVNIVRKGDVAALSEWIKTAPAVRGGNLSANQLRQVKDLFIVSATLVSRAAIQGGMAVERALTLSDRYIQRCELTNDIDKLTNLQFRMVADYTEQVDRVRRGGNPSKLVRDVYNYVQQHLSEPVNVPQMAKALYISKTGLSVKFKAETGLTLTEYVQREKIEEAKRLIKYTDKSLVAVSAYLGFSSQSHFSKVFKSFTGVTPKKYLENLH